MHRLAVLILLPCLCSCVSTGPRVSLEEHIPPGLYKFDCDVLYDNKMAEVTPHPKGVHVQLLEAFKGDFVLKAKSDNRVSITEGDMSYPGLKRNFEGKGEIISRGHVTGMGESWTAYLPGINKDHRDGEWTLRLATEQEQARWLRSQKKLNERKARAGFLEPSS